MFVGKRFKTRNRHTFRQKQRPFQSLRHRMRREKNTLIKISVSVFIRADLASRGRRSKPFCGKLHQFFSSCDVASCRRQTAPRVFYQRACNNIGAANCGFAFFRKFAVAIVHHNQRIRRNFLNNVYRVSEIVDCQCVAPRIAS